MDLKETDILGEDIAHHWYYRAKAAAMARFLGNTQPQVILDVGAGSGFFSHYLLKQTMAKEVWCVDISYTADDDVQEAGKLIHYRRSINAVNADLVLLMDVLEHVDDDVKLLKEYVDKTPQNSQFLITVPAFQFLWSGHDDFLEHKRRYTLQQLEEVIKKTGLQIQASAYYFGMVFPVAATLRLAQRISNRKETAQSQLKKHHPVVNTILNSLCNIEIPLMKFNRFAGLSVFCLAEKK